MDAKPAETRTLLLLAAGALVFLGTCRVLWIDEPFDNSQAGAIAGRYYGYSARVFDDRGLLNLSLQPALFAVPGTDDGFIPYRSHPPAPYALDTLAWRSFGRNERALRLPGIAALALLLAAAWRLARPRGGTSVAAAGLLLLATSPVLVHYGDKSDGQAFAVALLIPTLLAWRRWREAPSGPRYAIWCVAAGAGGLNDWFGFLVVPVVWADLLLRRPRPERLLRTAILAALPLGVAMLAYLAWLFHVTGGVDGVVEEWRWLLSKSSDSYLTSSWGFARAQHHMFTRCYGWPLLAPAAVGGLLLLGRMVRRRMTGLDPFLLMLVGYAALSIAAFLNWSVTHEEWPLQWAPVVAILAADAILRLGAHPVARVALLVGLAGWSGFAGVRLHDEHRTTRYADLGRALDGALEPGDVVISPDFSLSARYYTNVAISPTVKSREEFDAFIGTLRPARHAVKRLWLATTEAARRDHPWLSELPVLPSPLGEIPYAPRRTWRLTRLDAEALFSP